MQVESAMPILLAIVAAYIVARADFRRRHLPPSAARVVLWAAVAGVPVAVAFQFLGLGLNPPFDLGSESPVFAWFPGMVVAFVVVLFAAQRYQVPRLVNLDAVAPAAALGYATERIAWFLVRTSGHPEEIVPIPRFATAAVYEFVAGLLICWFLWQEGRRATQWQRPNGIVAGEYCVLTGLLFFWMESIRRQFRIVGSTQIAALALSAAGITLIAVVLRRYFAVREEHRILDHVSRWGEATQPEYTPATPECPNPERWKMYDTMTAEVEVLEFLKALVIAMKPNLIVETGTFTGVSTIAMAEGLRQNSFGKIITCEFDPRVFAAAKERIDSSGVGEWIECRNESSLEMTVDGTIDILFCDSDHEPREMEVRRFLPQVNPNGLILMHDAATHYKIVREGALRMQDEGLINLVLLPTPRGLAIAQKRRAKGATPNT